MEWRDGMAGRVTYPALSDETGGPPPCTLHAASMGNMIMKKIVAVLVAGLALATAACSKPAEDAAMMADTTAVAEQPMAAESDAMAADGDAMAPAGDAMAPKDDAMAPKGDAMAPSGN